MTQVILVCEMKPEAADHLIKTLVSHKARPDGAGTRFINLPHPTVTAYELDDGSRHEHREWPARQAQGEPWPTQR